MERLIAVAAPIWRSGEQDPDAFLALIEQELPIPLEDRRRMRGTTRLPFEFDPGRTWLSSHLSES